jgi:parallel beta-helix repeat protein
LSMEFVDNVVVSGSDIHNNTDHGIQLRDIHRSKLWRNVIQDNGDDGVHISGSEHVVAYRNDITNNGEYGIQLLDSSLQNLFVYNDVQHNGYGGAYIYDGELNLFFANTFANNTNFNVRDNDVNWWEANFYDDYQGRDLDGNVVGDEPYIIKGRRGAISFDNTPMTVPIWFGEGRGPLMPGVINAAGIGDVTFVLNGT